MQKGVESIGKFVVSGCDTVELLETIEESFDKVSRFVTMPVDFALGVAVAARRDEFGWPRWRSQSAQFVHHSSPPP